jgi:hypothetical protein
MSFKLYLPINVGGHPLPELLHELIEVRISREEADE